LFEIRHLSPFIRTYDCVASNRMLITSFAETGHVGRSQQLGYTASSDTEINTRGILEGSGRSLIETIYRHLLRGTEETHEKIEHTCWARGNDTMLEAGRSQVRFPMRSIEKSIGLILPAALWPWGRLSL
jgi:hypothetical protein